MDEFINVKVVHPRRFWKFFPRQTEKKGCYNKRYYSRPKRSNADFHTFANYILYSVHEVKETDVQKLCPQENIRASSVLMPFLFFFDAGKSEI